MTQWEYESTRNISKLWLTAHQPFAGQVILAALLAVPCTVVRCVVRTVGTVLFVIKVCTVHVGHCPPVSCMYEHVRVQALAS